MDNFTIQTEMRYRNRLPKLFLSEIKLFTKNKLIVFLLCLLSLCSSTQAQAQDFFHQIPNCTARATAVDASGNIYTTGSFSGNITLGTIAFVSNGSEDIFVAKYDAAGTLLWAKRAGGVGTDYAFSIAVSGGAVYITGNFKYTANFNTPSAAGSNEITDHPGTNPTGNDHDIFVAKYDDTGAFQWAKRAGGTIGDGATGIAVSGNAVYITGIFNSTANFNTPSATGSNEITSAGGNDIFLAKYDDTGAFQWVKRAGSTSVDQSFGISVSGSDVYITGGFQGTANFPSATGTHQLIAQVGYDIFVAKYDDTGECQWTRRAGAKGTVPVLINDFGFGIAATGSAVYITGSLGGGTADFNTPSATTGNTVTSAGGNDIFIAKFDNSGTFEWAKRAGGTGSDQSLSLAVSGSDVYIAGIFNGTTNFNTPSSGSSHTIVSVGGLDIFLAKYDDTGAFQWAKRAGGTGNDLAYGITVSGSTVYTAGILNNQGTPMAGFIANNLVCTPAVAISANPSGSITTGTSVTFTATPSNGGTPTYQWEKNGTVVGTNSVTYTDAALVNNDVITCVMTSKEVCSYNVQATSIGISMTVCTPVTSSVTITSDDADNTILPNTSVTFTATPANGGTTPTYIWKKNDVVISGEMGATYTTTTLANGDKIKVEMTSNDACASPTIATSSEITMLITSPCTTYVPSNITVTGSGVCTAGLGTYTPSGNVNGAPSWSNGLTALTWNNTLSQWEMNMFGVILIALNRTGSITNLPCSGWEITSSCETVPTLSGGCGSLTCGNSCTNPTAYNVTGGGAYCAGGTGVAVGLSNSETGITYQLKNSTGNVGAAVAGTGTAISFGNQTLAETYTVEATRTDGACKATMTGSVTVRVTTLPTATISYASSPFCGSAANSLPTITGTTGGYFSYTDPTDDISLNIDNGTLTSTVAGTYHIVYTIPAANGCPAVSATTEVVINPTPTVNNISNQMLCNTFSTTAVTFSGAVNGTVYNWTNNTPSIGLAASGTGNIASFTAINTGTSPVTATITVTPAYTNGGVTCTGATKTFTITVNPLPTATITGSTTICQNTTSPNITFTGANGKVPYQFTYCINGGNNQMVSTSDGNSVTVSVPTNNAGTFTYTLLSVSDANTCGQAQSGTATVTVKPIHLIALISATKSPTGCINTALTPITFTLSGGATGADVSGLPTGVNASVYNGVLTLSGTPSVSGVFNYSIVTTGNECATASESGIITLNTKPTFTLSVNQQTFNEGNNPILCDTDANPNNSLQLTVNNSCVAGPVLWRSQVGAGAWSDWSTTAPSSQPSSNIAYKYQAACDAACPSTLSGIITLTINYRAATPQKVSLVADGTTVAAGESKTICNIEGNEITFNATCAAEEMVLYSVDGGDYSSVIPSQIVDNAFHNYRVRCRKADNTPSCVVTESAVMSLKITTPSAAPTVSITPTSNCGTPTAFSGNASCGNLTTVWYNATTNQALPTLPATTPNATSSYYARCLAEAGCESEKSNLVTFTLTPVNDAPAVTVSAELVCAGTEVTISTTCPAGTTALWNTGITEASFKIAFSNVTKATYTAKCVSANGCQSPVSVAKTVSWKGFELTFINVGQSQSAIKVNDKAAWASQFITPDAGPSLDYSTEANPTIYFSENVNKTAPRFWTIHAETCNLGTDGSLTFNMLATPELGVVRSYNTHENNAPYFMYANRGGFTELYAQNHPAYGFFADNGSAGNVYDEGLPKGLYKLGVRYWDQKGQGSIFPSTRQPAGNVLAYQEYWFRIQSKDGIGVGNARVAAATDNGAFAQVMPNPVSNTLHLKVNEAKDQKVNVSLVDASGRALLQRAFVPESNQHKAEFEVSQLSNGIYFLKVNTIQKQTVLKVLKVQ